MAIKSSELVNRMIILEKFCRDHRVELTRISGIMGERCIPDLVDRYEYERFINSWPIETFIGNYCSHLYCEEAIDLFREINNGEYDFDGYIRTVLTEEEYETYLNWNVD